MCFRGVEAWSFHKGSAFSNSMCREASRDFRMHFVCIKMAKFVHNLIPDCNNLVKDSGLFYFIIIFLLCVQKIEVPSFILSIFLFLPNHMTKLQGTMTSRQRAEPFCSGLEGHPNPPCCRTVVSFITSRGLFALILFYSALFLPVSF